MRYLLTRAGVAELERRSAEAGVAEDELMLMAGTALAGYADDMAQAGSILVLCGIGNNAGDGWVAARVLLSRGRQVTVVSAGAEREDTGLAGSVKQEALEAGVPHVIDTDGTVIPELLEQAALVVDCMFGAGFHGTLREPYATWACLTAESCLPVLACDLPSGMEADTPNCSPGTLQADLTMATIAVKMGMRTGEDHDLCGDILVEDLGVATNVPGGLAELAIAEEWELDDYAALLPLPEYDDNKYTRGHVAVIAGSDRYAGAALLCADAARRGGAGYATLCAPEPLRRLAQGYMPAAPVQGFAEREGAFAAEAAGELAALADACQAFAVGPGITVTEGTAEVVRALCGCSCPGVFDADAVNILSQNPAWLEARKGKGASVLTPHAGERRRLLDAMGLEVDRQEHSDMMLRIEHDKQLADRFGVVLVDKGPETVITDGRRTVLFSDAPSALATSGTGDVLSGVIASLLSAGLEVLEAACLGVALHGYAGAIAACELTDMCVTAEDVLRHVPTAVEFLIEG